MDIFNRIDKLEHKYVLLSGHINWADEIDLGYSYAITKDQFYWDMKEIENRFVNNKSMTLGFGSNEDVKFNTFEEYVYKIDYNIKSITTEEYNVLKSFGLHDLGVRIIKGLLY